MSIFARSILSRGAAAVLGGLLLAGASASPCHASPGGLDERVSVGQPPRPLRVRVDVVDGEVVLRAGARRVVLPLPNMTSARTETTTLEGGAAVAVVRASDGTHEAAAIVTRDERGRPAVPWTGHLDLRGDPGERTSDALEIGDRTGDGVPDVVVGTYRERVRLCGQSRTLLDPRAIDPGSLSLRAVALDRLGATTADVPTIDATTTSPGPSAPAVLRGLRPAGASSRAGAAHDPSPLPPIEVADGDARTFWTEAHGGRGRGEFVTLVRDSTLFPIRALALVLRPLDAASEDRIARPATLWLVGDDGARLRVRVPAAGYETAGQRLWVTPPSPLAWKCLSVSFDTHHAPGTGYGTIAEVEAYTELDFGDGARTLVDAMNGEGQRADDAALLARELGAPVLSALEAAWPTLGAPGRRRGVRVLAILAAREAQARTLLVRALEDDDVEARDAARDALIATLPESHDLLAPRIATADAIGDALALAVAKHAADDALAPLLAALADDAGSGRPALREALALVAGTRPDATTRDTRAWAATPSASIAARAAAALALARVPATAAVAAELLERTATEANEFSDRWRLVRAAAALPARPATDAWLSALAVEEERWMLRAEAVTALHARGATDARATARRALDDAYPRVRMAAIATLADDRESFERLAKHARRDLWTMVRVAALDALAPQPGAEAVLREAVSDPRRRVRAAAIDGLARARARTAWPLVRARLEDENEWPEVTRAAVGFARALCVREAEDALVAALERGMRPDAWEPDVRLALEAMGALQAFGGDAARRAHALATSAIAPEAFRATANRAESESPACAAP